MLDLFSMGISYQGYYQWGNLSLRDPKLLPFGSVREEVDGPFRGGKEERLTKVSLTKLPAGVRELWDGKAFRAGSHDSPWACRGWGDAAFHFPHPSIRSEGGWGLHRGPGLSLALFSACLGPQRAAQAPSCWAALQMRQAPGPRGRVLFFFLLCSCSF